MEKRVGLWVPWIFLGLCVFIACAEDETNSNDNEPSASPYDLSESYARGPQTKFKSTPPNPTNSTTAVFRYSCNVANCTFQCKLDASNWAKCKSSKTYMKLSDGEHTFMVRAINSSGRKDPTPATYGWKIQLGSWTPTSTAGAPEQRLWHRAIWTGTEMIIWGGNNLGTENSSLATGGRYNPTTDSWNETSLTNSPSQRCHHTAIWTNSEMIVWGGYYYDAGDHYLNDGGKYNPATNSWSAISLTNAPAGRENHSAIWTTTEMIVWGGWYWDGSGHYFNDGGRYNPGSNSWTAISLTDAPSARYKHTAIWTNTEMIVWGGNYWDSVDSYLNSGGRYNPAANTWSATSLDSAPAGRIEHTAIWTGDRMIIWGGGTDHSYDSFFNTGGLYNPSGNCWTMTSNTGYVPLPRYNHSAIWTGSEMIVWGGGYWGSASSDESFNDGGRYNPATNIWKEVYTIGAPTRREDHTAVWTGSQMIIWGGQSLTNTGGRYTP